MQFGIDKQFDDLNNHNHSDIYVPVEQLQANSYDFYFDYQDSQYGWNSSSSRGADTFHPFSSGGAHITYLAQFSGNISYNCKTGAVPLSNWQSLTAANFFPVLYYVTGSESSHGSDTPGAISLAVTISYNNTTGVVSATCGKSSTKGRTTINATGRTRLYYTDTPIPTTIGNSI